MEGPWYGEGLRFGCTSCGGCCRGAPGYVWLSRREAERLARHLGLEPARFRRECLKSMGRRLSLREQANGDCIFFREPQSLSNHRSAPVLRRPTGAEEGEAACRGRCGGGLASPANKEPESLSNSCSGSQGCMVYPVRPRQCRTFPFWSENLKDAAAWEALRPGCPGIGEGRLFPSEEIRRIRMGRGEASELP